MRVLHVNKFLYRRGGAESYMFDVAGLQGAAGDQVAFFGMQHPSNIPTAFESSFPPNVELEPPPDAARSRVAAAGRMIWSPASRRGMAQVIAAFRPDVAHLHNIYHQLSPSVLRPLSSARVPTVMTLHDYKLACASYQFLDHGRICEACVDGSPWQAVRRRCKDDSLGASSLLALETWLHRRTGAYAAVDAFVSPSRFLADRMRRAGVFPDRMLVLPHFVEPTAVSADVERAGLVFAGRLSPEKGVDVLIDAVGRLPDLALDIAGDGPQRSALEQQAEAVAPGRVRFRGRLDKAEVTSLLAGALAAVVPSRWHENQPMVVLEAFAAGTPVVATDLGGLPELVRHGREGICVPPDDPAALAAGIAELLGQPGRLAMGAAARQRVENDFSPAAHLAGLRAVYEEAGRRSRARGAAA